jgi:hypothetical protein
VNGGVGRREFLRAGLTGFAGLSWPGLFRLRAAAAQEAKPRAAVILVWLRGGASNLETYDPKPEAPAEVRGVFSPIPTRVPGMRVSELLPLHAKIADRFTLVRSMSHTGGGHPAGSLQMLTGDPDAADKPRPVWMTVSNLLRADRSRALPNYVGVNPVSSYDGFVIAGSAYVSPAYGPFSLTGDPSDPRFEVPNIGLRDAARAERLGERVRLKQRLDALERAADPSGAMGALDDFEAQALQLLTSPRAAFDPSREPGRVRDPTAATPGASSASWPAARSKRASRSSRRPSTAPSAAASGTGTTTPSTTTSSTRCASARRRSTRRWRP